MTSHLYLRRGPSAGLLVIRHDFTGPGAPAVSRTLVPQAERADWLAALVVDPDLKAVYNCFGSGAAAPEGLGCAWIELHEGHPCEKL